MNDQDHRHDETYTIDDYLASLTDDERREVTAAGTAIDLAFLLYRARERRGLTQREAAERASMRQQAVSRMEQVSANVQLLTLRKYLGALGYTLEISIRDADTGELAERVGFPLIGERIPAD